MHVKFDRICESNLIHVKHFAISQGNWLIPFKFIH
jgi:hypothetical protein